MKRLLAAALCAALIAVSPGLAPYAAAADIVAKTPAPPVQIGTSQLNVLKGAGALPVSPGALGVDPTQRVVPALPTPAVPGAEVKPEAKPGDVSQTAQQIAPKVEQIAKPETSGETSAQNGEQITELLQGGSSSSNGGVAEGGAGDNAGGLSASQPSASSKSEPPVPAAPKKSIKPKLVALAVSTLRGAQWAAAAVLAAPQLPRARQLAERIVDAEPAKGLPAALGESVAELSSKINSERASLSRKPLPAPAIERMPLAIPNLFTAGLRPKNSAIVVSEGLIGALLEPQSAREGLIRLVQASAADVQGKSYRLYRAAISASINGLSSDASPNEVAQALVRAGDAQIQDLGRRMMRGVVGRELARASSGGMSFDAIGTVLAADAALMASRLLGAARHVDRAAPGSDAAAIASPEIKAKVLSLEHAKAEISEAEESASDDVVAKPTTRVSRWVSRASAAAVRAIRRVTASRRTEAAVDRDGAALSDDPEALALALGLMASWRPAPGYKLEASFAPRLAAIAPLMAIDPLAQTSQKADVRARVEALFDLAAALHKNGAQDFRPRPPTVLAAPEAPRGGFLHRAWENLKGFIKVLPDKQRNRTLWRFIWGQALVSLGLDFHYTALPKLVDPNEDKPSNVMYNRAVNAGSQLSSSLMTGAAADRYSVQKLMVWTYLGRTLMLMAVPILFQFGMLSFLAFQLIIFANGFLQSTSMTAASVAFNRIIGDDTAYYNKANAVYNLVLSLVGIAGPLMAGSFIVLLNSHLGFLAGNAWSYAAYALTLLAAMLLYRKLRLPRDEMLQARRDLWAQLKGKIPGVKGVTSGRVDNKPVLVVEVKGDPASITGVPSEFAGFPVKVAPKVNVWRELSLGARLIFKDNFLKIYVLFSTVASLIADPIVFSAIPRYIDGILHVAKHAQGGVFGLYLTATGLGTGLASFAMMLLRDHTESRLEAALAGSKAGLMASGSLDDASSELALDAVRESRETVMARYRRRWAKEPDWEPAQPLFQQEFLEAAAQAVNAKVFGNKKTRTELVKLFADSGLNQRLWDWSGRSFKSLMKDGRRHASSGLNHMERQGRWSSWLNGLGWLLYWGVFFLPTLHWSLTAIVVASMLQAPAMAIWSGIVQHVLGTRYREDMGKIYSFINFYTLVFGILGPIGYTFLAGKLSLVGGLLLTMGALTVVAIFDFIQPKKSFPLDKKSKR